MLKPSKHMDPSRSVLALSAVILRKLQKARVCSYSALLDHARSNSNDTDSLFMGSLALIYLLGLVKYRVNTDSFEYIEQPKLIET